MTVTNSHKDAQKYVDRQGGKGAFCIATGSAFFTITTTNALQAGDKINFILYSSKGNTVGLKLNNIIIGDVTMGSSSSSWTAATEYTVTIGDALIGKTEIKVERTQSKGTYFTDFTITRSAAAPAAVSFSPVAGSVAEGTSITLTSTGATTIKYQWSSSAINGEGDWSSATTYDADHKPVVPTAGSTNTVLSVKASNTNGDTYGSASYTPVKMALKTIYSLNDGIGSQTKTADNAAIDGTTSMSFSNTAGRIKLTAASGFQFKNGDAISFSGTIGNTSKKYGIKYGSTTDLGTDLYVAAGAACNVSGTLTLASETGELYIGRYDGTNTTMTSFVIRQLTEATSEEFTGVKINGSAATVDDDYTIEGSTITLDGTFTEAPNVVLVNHIVFADASTEDQNLVVPFGNPNGEFFTGTVTIDGTTYTVKAPCGNINAIKVQYKYSSTVIKEENLDVTGLKVGASYTVPFRMYVEKDGALYKTTANGSNPYYGDAVTLAYNTTVTKSLSTVDLEGGTIELFEDFDGDASQNANIRASNCSAYNNTAYTSVNDLPSGTYKFIVKAQNKGRGSSVKVGETTVFTITDVNAGTGSWTDVELTDKVVPTAGKLSFVKGGSNTIDCYDILIAIRQVPVPADPTTSGDETYLTTSDNMAGWRAFYDATNSYSVDGNTKVYVADVDPVGSTITMKSITGIPANVPVILHTSSSADSHKMTLTKETGSPFSYTGTNKLEYTTSAVSEKYRLGYGASGVGFYPYSGTPASGAVILNVSSAAARALTMVFDDSETTGIFRIENSERIDNSVYNLRGQRVAQPTKGLYIVNGKKVMFK